MTVPYLEAAIVLPLLGAVWIGRMRNFHAARQWSAVVAGLTFACALLAWRDAADSGYESVGNLNSAASPRGFASLRWLSLDELSAPLLPMVALQYLLTTLATLRTKMRRFSFALSLVSEAIRLATFACRAPWGIIVLLALGTIPPYLELRHRERPTRNYVLHMSTSVVLAIVAWTCVELEGPERPHSLWAVVPLLIAVCIRSGMAPFHLWMADLFENATLGTSLLYVIPITGAYAVVRLVLPIAPDGVLQILALISLATVVYAAGMALVQRDARRLCCYLFLSHSALVFVGLECINVIGLTGALSVWLSIGLSLCGFGLTLRSLESRFGRLSLDRFHGLYDQTPALAVFFCLTGLATVGFPGTLGFVGGEMLVDGVVEVYPHVGMIVVIANALNGIAVIRAYFLLFTGNRHSSTVSLESPLRERIAVLTLTALILLGGIVPQPYIQSRYLAAKHLLHSRSAESGALTP